MADIILLRNKSGDLVCPVSCPDAIKIPYEDKTLSSKLEEISGDFTYTSEDVTSGVIFNVSNSLDIDGTYKGATTEVQNFGHFPKITLNNGDKIIIRTKGTDSGSARAWTICNLSNTVIAIASLGADFTENPYIYTADLTCYVYVNCANNVLNKASIHVKLGLSKIDKLQNRVTEIDSSLEDLDSINNSINGGNVNIRPSNIETGVLTNLGEVENNSSEQAKFQTYTFSVKPGKTYTVHTKIESSDGTGSRSFLSTYGDNGFIKNVEKVQNYSETKEMTKDFVFDEGVTYIKTYFKASAYPNEAYCILKESSVDDRISNLGNSVNTQIEEFKNGFVDKETYTEEDLEAGYYYIGETEIGAKKTPGKQSNAGNAVYYCMYLEIKKGDTIKIYTRGGSNGRAYLITTMSNIVLSNCEADTNTISNPFEYTATEPCKVYSNCEGSKISNFKITVEGASIKDRINAIEESIPEFGNQSKISNPPIDIRKRTITINNVEYSTNPLRVLDIGNSFTDDSIEYLKPFMDAANLSYSDMCFYTLVRGGGSFKTFYDSWHNQDTDGCNYLVHRKIGMTQPIPDGTNLEKMQSAIKDCKWDIIVIHQLTTYSNVYQDWEGNGAGGYLTEFIRILKTYQPEATIAVLFAHCSWERANGNTVARFEQEQKGIKYLTSNYGVDFIIPVATAIENLRASSTLNVSPVQYGFSRDKHHLAPGLAKYVAAATYYQALIGRRYGITVLGNTYTYTVETDERNSVTYPDECVDVTNSNKELAQICAINACSNMFEIIPPEGIINTL